MYAGLILYPIFGNLLTSGIEELDIGQDKTFIRNKYQMVRCRFPSLPTRCSSCLLLLRYLLHRVRRKEEEVQVTDEKPKLKNNKV